MFIVPFCRFRRVNEHRYEKRDGAGKAEREEMVVHLSGLPQAEHFSTYHLSNLTKRGHSRWCGTNIAELQQAALGDGIRPGWN